MTLRSPTYELTIAGRRWTTHLIELDLRVHGAPVPDSLTARFPAAADTGARPGDPVMLRLDGGDGARDAFTGEVDAVIDDLHATTITAIDAGGVLARARLALTLEQATAASVIRALCAEVDAPTGTLDDGVQLAWFSADPGRTAWEHIARVAGWGGAIARVDPDGRVSTLVAGTGPADVALRHGRDVVTLERLEARPRFATAVVAGETGVGSVDDPDVLRPTTDFFAGNRPDGPGPDTSWTFEPALRTASDARAFGDARRTGATAARHRWRLESLLRPELRPGDRVSIGDLPERLPAETLLTTSVRHVLSAARVRTTARLVASDGGSSGPTDLLAAAGAAVRGLA